MYKITYHIQKRLIATFYKPNEILAKWFVKQLKKENNYRIGKFKIEQI